MGNSQGTAVAGNAAQQQDAAQTQYAQQTHSGQFESEHGQSQCPPEQRRQADQRQPSDPAAPRPRFDERGHACVVIRPDTVTDEHGGTLTTGISRDTVASKALSMHLAMLPPGTRGTPHFHSGHESAIWVAMGEVEVWHGPGLCGRTVVHAGDFLYIPADVPHLPVNRSQTEMMVAVVARTDPAQRESVVVFDLPPHLDGLFAIPVAMAL
jgi:uncharacterized RmlC-like cupin family protein